MLKYYLQFFAEGDDNGEMENSGSVGTNDNDNDNSNQNDTDISALADLISDKDKQIQQLEKDIAELKKSNAQLLVRVNASSNPPEQPKSFEENLLGMVGYKPRRE